MVEAAAEHQARRGAVECFHQRAAARLSSWPARSFSWSSKRGCAVSPVAGSLDHHSMLVADLLLRPSTPDRRNRRVAGDDDRNRLVRDDSTPLRGVRYRSDPLEV